MPPPKLRATRPKVEARTRRDPNSPQPRHRFFFVRRVRFSQANLNKDTAVARVVVVGGSYAGVELSCNLATELGGKSRKGAGKVEVTLATSSEVRGGACGMASVTLARARRDGGRAGAWAPAYL